jgi:signal transduction histidine kinase
MKSPGRRTPTLLFVAGLAVFLLFSLVGFKIASQYEQTVSETQTGDNVRYDLSLLLTELDDAETGQRGYIITGNATYLQPYQDAIQSINGTESGLQGLIGGLGGSALVQNLTSQDLHLQFLTAEKLSELNQTLIARQTQGFAAAQALVNSNTGELYMDEIRSVISSMTSEVQGAQSQEVSLAASQSGQRLELTAGATLFATALIALGAYSLNRSLSSQQAALEDAERSRRRAELMRDILTHDIRNYNQISRANAELLEDSLTDEKLRGFAGSILNSVDGSSELIQRVRMLQNVMSQKEPVLENISLDESFERSLSLVRKAFPDRVIETPTELPKANVTADGLLDQVFVNLLTNAVKYTEGKRVQLDVRLQEEALGGSDNLKTGKYWKVTFADHGTGIPDELKEKVFMRYLGAAQGRGLGLSIVRALVVERYHGRLELHDRVSGDRSQGTRVELWLPEA